MISAESPMRTPSCSIHGDFPFGPLLGSFSSIISNGSPAMRSHAASFRGNGAAVSKGTPHPEPNANSRTFSDAFFSMNASRLTDDLTVARNFDLG